MKKILFFMVLSVSFLFSSINVQTATKDELMCIKGIGEKKVATFLKYRKSHQLKSVDDLLEIKGFGKGIISNIKSNIKSVACGGKKSTKKKSISKKTTTKKVNLSQKKSEKIKLEKKLPKTEKKKSEDKSDLKTAA